MRQQNPSQPESATASLDLRRPLSRREALSLLGGAASAAFVVGCGGAMTDTTVASGTTTGTTTPTTGSCTRVAEETAGPFPSNGTNSNAGVTKNVLADARVFRNDIRSDLDGGNTQPGTPFTVTLTLLNSNGSCGVLAGYYVYLWHCNATGSYSQYSGNNNGGDFSDRSFLRGVGVSDANGQVTFTTVFPGRYAGRATHMHFQVYPDNTPVNGEQRATSQLAFPAAITDGSGSPYTNTTLYPNSASNNTSNTNDGIFSDGTSTEMLTITGSNSAGYVGTITVAVAA